MEDEPKTQIFKGEVAAAAAAAVGISVGKPASTEEQPEMEANEALAEDVPAAKLAVLE